ncbi:TIGR02444 family protein [Photobacterium japonica]|uniref:TIGR02444 family protein n=1 Tax=Photobacterium japonica TaxID=2910235 RepID=UPI003D150671
MTPTLTAADFWQFSLHHYRQAGVEAACLQFQDQYQGNVNLALLLHWLDTQSFSLPPQELTALLTTLAHSDPSLQRFRAQRRVQKAHLSTSTYQALLAEELQHERQQQTDLIQQCQTLPLRPAIQPHNLLAYCQHCHVPTVLYRQLQGHTTD